MSKKIKETDLINAINDYAKAYEKLDFLQTKSELIPIGDQKTGAIGEYIGKKILEAYFKENFKFLGHSNKGRDVFSDTKFYQIRVRPKFCV